MSTRRTRKPRRTGRNSTVSDMSKIISELHDLAATSRQQLRFGQPNTRDIVFPNIRQNKVHTFVVSYPLAAINQSATAASPGAYYFSISQLNLGTSFTQLFDRYRITHAQIQFDPSPTTVGPGNIVTAIDYDDASTPSAEIAQRDTAMTVPLGTYFERTLQPRLAVAAYSGAFSSYANMPPSTWIDSSSPNVQYYGLKYLVPTGTAMVTVYNPTVRLVLQCMSNF